MTPYYRQQVRKLDKDCAPDSPAGAAVALMLAALIHGSRKAGALARVTGVPTRDAFPIARRLRSNGIWRNGKTYADWANDKSGAVAFWMDVNVAIGHMNRTRTACQSWRRSWSMS